VLVVTDEETNCDEAFNNIKCKKKLPELLIERGSEMTRGFKL